ncbi:MAG: hypothetical protein Q8M19_24535 [Reyranella sp.]|nr:hypothetical protein [Reyranella sp.]
MARKSPDATELQTAIHALAGVFEALNWIEHDQLNKPEDELLEVKHSLIIAGQLITEDLRRRF